MKTALQILLLFVTASSKFKLDLFIATQGTLC